MTILLIWIYSQTSLTVSRTKLVIYTTRSSYTNNHVYWYIVHALLPITYVLLHLHTINRRSSIFIHSNENKHDNYADTYSNIILLKVWYVWNKNPWSITVMNRHNWLFRLAIFTTKMTDFLDSYENNVITCNWYSYVHVWHACKWTW